MTKKEMIWTKQFTGKSLAIEVRKARKLLENCTE